MSNQKSEKPDEGVVRIGCGILCSLAAVMLLVTWWFRSEATIVPSGGGRASGHGAAASVAGVPFKAQVPVLMVRGSAEEMSGEVARLDLTTEHRGEGPLTIAIAEDSPSGSGVRLRASIWQAAMVAALHREDSLTGVRIGLSVPGVVDGPSAGAAVCLAILCALDERTLPDDLAVTGTVLPDGTVGRVGGMPQKLRAARAAGFRRVLAPEFLRFEDAGEGQDPIDLRELCEQLGLEYIPVENIDQAYRIVRGVATAPQDSQRLKPLPSDIEGHLKAGLLESLREGDALYQSIPAGERQTLESDPTFALFIRTRSQADQAMRSGKFLYGRSQAQLWASLMRGRQANQAFFAGVNAPDLASILQKARERTDQALRGIPSPSAKLSTQARRDPAIASQLLTDLAIADQASALIQAVELRDQVRLTLAGQSGQSPVEGTALEDYLSQAVLGSRATQLMLALAIEDSVAAADRGSAVLATKLGRPAVSPKAEQVEGLFWKAFSAAHHAFEAELASQAQQLRVRPDEAMQALVLVDDLYTLYQVAPATSDLLHQEINAAEAGSPRREFTVALSAQVHAIHLAAVSGLMARWSELDGQWTDGGAIEYGRKDVLEALLRSARSAAVSKVAECQTRGILCLQPRYHLEEADMTRDDPRADKIDVLVSYWAASLQAQTLLMLFEGDRQ